MIGNFLYKNPRLLVLVIGIILTAGLAALHVMPRMEDPVLTRRVALVTTSFPGADPVRVETLVTEKLEEKLRDIEQIKSIQSSSGISNSIIVVELRDEIVAVDPVWSLVRDTLADAATELPAEVSRPRLRTLPLKAYAAIIALKWARADEANYAILRRLAEDLRHSLRGIPGTERVDLFGDPGEEIVVEVEPATLSTLKLTPDDIAQQLRGSITQRSAGLVRGRRSEMLMSVDEVSDSLKRVGETPIAYGREGRLVSLADISIISKGITQPPSSLAIVDGAPAVTVAAFVRDDYRVDDWTAKLNERISGFKSGLPTGVQADMVFVQNDYVEDRLRGLLVNLLLGTLAVTVVVFFAMGWRSMLVVAAALPLSALMVLMGMRALGIPIHQMSITGLIIALGLLIDNAIVIVDEVRARLWNGLSANEAITDGVKHLAMPLFGSTLTTTLAFAPIALLPGPPGEFVRSIAISVILAICSSFLLAMTVIPALTALLQPPTTQRRTLWRYGISSSWMTEIYDRSLRIMFRWPVLGVLLGITLPLFGFLAAATLPEQFFPAADRDQIQIELELAASAPISKTRQVADAARQIALAHDQVARVHWFLGQSAPTFFYNVMPRRSNAAFYAQALVELKPVANPRNVIRQLQDELDLRLAECRVLVRQLEQGPPFDAPVEVQLSGPDTGTLQRLGSEIRLLLSQTSEVLHTRSDLEEQVPKLAMQVNQTETGLAGLSLGEVTRQIYSSVEGSDGGSLMEGTEELPIRVRFSAAARSDIDQIGTTELQSPRQRGPNVAESPTLGGLTQLNLASEVATIPHIDGQRMNEVKAYITAGTLPAEVVTEFERRMAASDFRLPAGYSIDYGGEAAKRNEAVRNLLADVAVLVALMVATLVISFRSFRISMIIAAVGALSIGLGSLALWAFAYPFGFMAILGTMGLVGVAINDAIVVMAGIRQDPRANVGDIPAISAVVVGRTRHVIATSLTTMAGFTPLVLGGGSFWPPLAIAIAGGVGGATILALYFVPSLYLLMCGRNMTATS